MTYSKMNKGSFCITIYKLKDMLDIHEKGRKSQTRIQRGNGNFQYKHDMKTKPLNFLVGSYFVLEQDLI